MRTNVLAITLTLAALIACKGKPGELSQGARYTTLDVTPVDYATLSTNALLAREHAIDEFVWYAFPDLPDGAPLARLRAVGKLPMERVRLLDNEYVPGQKIEERTFEYDGLVVTGQNEAGTLRFWYAKVTKPAWKVRSGLGVGASLADVTRVLGPPNAVKGDAIEYQGESESARFRIRDGRVAELECIHYHE